MIAASWIDQRTGNLTEDAVQTRLGVVEDEVRGTMGSFTNDAAANACRKEVVVGRKVGFAEILPCDAAYEWIGHRNIIVVAVIASSIEEDAAMKRMRELVAAVAIGIEHELGTQVSLDMLPSHVCPTTITHEVVPTPDNGVDDKGFAKRLKNRPTPLSLPWREGSICSTIRLQPPLGGKGRNWEGIGRNGKRIGESPRDRIARHNYEK